MNFDLSYIETSDQSPNEKVHCMKCGTLIAETGYEERPKINSPKETVRVQHLKPLWNYRQVPMLMALGEGHKVIHLLVCLECEKFEWKPEYSDLIIKQILRATKQQLDWAGMPESAYRAQEAIYKDAVILHRLNEQEQMDHYAPPRRT